MENCSGLNKPSGLRRRSVGQEHGGPNLPLKLEVGFQVDEGVIKGTPSPGSMKMITEDDDDRDCRASSSMAEFRKKQQSFEIHIEDCDEEEMSGGSSDEGGSRPITPVPPQLPDCSGNVTYKERKGAPQDDFLRVGERDLECLTDVSEGESENEEGTEDYQGLPPNTVIKRVP